MPVVDGNEPHPEMKISKAVINPYLIILSSCIYGVTMYLSESLLAAAAIEADELKPGAA